MYTLSRRGVAATAMLCLTAATSVLAVSATASAGLSVTPITWNVIGLDSNKPATSGPDTFPVGTRVCNDGDDALPAVDASLVWDSANAYLAVIGPSTMSLGDLAAGACTDAYFNVQVSRTTAAYDTTRAFHVTAMSGSTSVSTPADRELYVEKLVSQNRNGVDAITSTAIDSAPSSTADGHATVNVGETYVFHVTSHTATGGYEQLESAVDFPSTIFRVLDVSASYTVPSGATNDRMYADACGWDAWTTSASYRSCVGPTGYSGGKAGGHDIETDYTVEVVAAGAATVTPIIYDFSGSSFHYNSDLGLATASVDVDAVDPSEQPPATPSAVDDDAATEVGTPVTVDVLDNDTLGTGTTTVTEHGQPAHGAVSCDGSTCEYTPADGYDGVDTFDYTITDANDATSTATVTVTVSPTDEGAVDPAPGDGGDSGSGDDDSVGGDGGSDDGSTPGDPGSGGTTGGGSTGGGTNDGGTTGGGTGDGGTGDGGETAVLPAGIQVPHAKPDSSGGVLGLHGARPSSASPLPYTGAPSGQLAVDGVLLLLVGSGLCVAQRRRRSC